MNYRVIWSDDALAELDAIWESSTDKECVEHTATRVNTELDSFRSTPVNRETRICEY